MRYLALACDYDGTLASAGKVPNETLSALERLIKSGRKLILVSGRDLPDLLTAFPRGELFAAMVKSAARRFCRFAIQSIGSAKVAQLIDSIER
jgi:HAD superfamily hydrolase (TIGR01484 family)